MTHRGNQSKRTPVIIFLTSNNVLHAFVFHCIQTQNTHIRSYYSIWWKILLEILLDFIILFVKNLTGVVVSSDVENRPTQSILGDFMCLLELPQWNISPPPPPPSSSKKKEIRRSEFLMLTYIEIWININSTAGSCSK